MALLFFAVTESDFTLKVFIAYEMLKQWPSAPLPAYLPDLRVITELDLRGDEMRTYAHRVIVHVGSRACTAHISAEGEDVQIQQFTIHISTCTLMCTHDTHVHTHKYTSTYLKTQRYTHIRPYKQTNTALRPLLGLRRCGPLTIWCTRLAVHTCALNEWNLSV